MYIILCLVIVLGLYFPIMAFFNGDATPFFYITGLIAIVIGQLWTIQKKIK